MYHIISINEYSTKNIAIEADTADEAAAIAEELYNAGRIDMSRYGSVDFDIEHEDLSADDAKGYSDIVFSKEGI